MASFQTLKKAEEEAFRLVEDARKERTRRMKAAKTEAKEEIERYRSQQMEKLHSLKASSEEKGSQLADMEKKTNEKIEALRCVKHIYVYIHLLRVYEILLFNKIHNIYVYA
mmetsp:Transcript_4833/g.5519  ORF Transcript_4833/g.5519 Transcript_4833/m.5519 type:complete len:111 (+) Transcript_4833:183-515(+)